MTQVDLTRAELEHLIRLVGARKRQNERKLKASTFVPEPGHRNAHAIYIEVSDKLLAKLQAAVTEFEYELPETRDRLKEAEEYLADLNARIEAGEDVPNEQWLTVRKRVERLREHLTRLEDGNG